MDDVPLWPEGSTCKPSADVGSGRGAALSPTKTIAPVIPTGPLWLRKRRLEAAEA